MNAAISISNRVNLSLLTPPPAGAAAGARGTEREDAEDESPGDYDLLSTAEEKFPTMLICPNSHQAIIEYMQLPHEHIPNLTNGDAFNIGIAYINQFCNITVPGKIYRSRKLKNGKGLPNALAKHKMACLALVLHAVAYGWHTLATHYENLYVTGERPENKEAHHLLVMPLLKFACQYMNPHGHFVWNKVLEVYIKQFVDNARDKMRLFGVWSIPELARRLKEEDLRGGKNKWMGGMRYELARLLMHLSHIEPVNEWLHPINGACTAQERANVLNRTPMDLPNGVECRRFLHLLE